MGFLLVQRWEVVGVELWVFGVWNHSYDCALERSSLQQTLADELHVPRGVDAEPDGGTRQDDLGAGQQQRQATRESDSGFRRHGSVPREPKSSSDTCEVNDLLNVDFRVIVSK